MKKDNNKKSADEMIGSISETKDYDWFSFYPGNRDIVEEFLRRLNKVMRERPLPIPIIVNENGQIIDGQHTFLARKELELPIFYKAIPGATLKDRDNPFLKPIVVNEKFQVIDGQFRVEAAKKLDMPINYMIIKGTGIQDAKMLNIHQLDYPANESEYPEITENPKV